MLIEFSVSNFKSFREKQTFSMVAAPRLKNARNVFKPNVEGETAPKLLKIAAIYGSNASGKSNLIAALALVARIARSKPDSGSTPLPVAPFRFDPSLANEPSRVELNFIHAGQRYEFKLGANAERIVEERLTMFPRGRETLLYERMYIDNGDKYSFGTKLEGNDALFDTWRKLTGPRVLFIAQAVANSNEELKQLRKPFQWLQNGLMAVDEDLGSWAKITQQIFANERADPSMKGDLTDSHAIAQFLQEVDVPVTQIQFEPIVESKEIGKANASQLNELSQLGAKLSASFPRSKTTLTHKSALGNALFDFQEESRGTQNLIGFWFPWNALVTPGMQLFRVIVVDELDSSLHPKIVTHLVERHLELEQPAQLIFTTHDTHLMDTKLLRRDQFWLTDRDANGATQLRSIHDFDGRESEDIEKRYFEGRYRGLPLLRRR